MNRRLRYSGFLVCALAYALTIQAALAGYFGASAAGIGGNGISLALLCSQRTSGDTPVVPGHGADMLCCVAGACAGTSPVFVQRDWFEHFDPVMGERLVAAMPVASVVVWPSERPKTSRAPPA